MDLKISTLRQRYASGTLTVRQLLSELYQRCQAAPQGIWIELVPMAMLEQCAARLERLPPGALPLHGIPFAIKDNIDLAGVPTTAACPAYRYIPKHSATVVEKLIAAGAVPLGKTNMDQFATGLVGTRSPHGIPPNKLAPGYVTGGSSSGSAAALAHELCSFALGTDTAGSGRVPAAFNGLVGLKPSRGILSTAGVVPACRSLDCVSIFTLDASDALTVLDATAGADADDAYSRVAPDLSPFPAGWRFGIPRADQLEFFGNTPYATAYHHYVKQLERSGGVRQEIDFSPFLEAARLLYQGPWVFERHAAVGEFIEQHPGDVLPVIRQIITPEKIPHPAEVFKAMHKLQALKRRADAVFAEVDLIVTPTTGTIYRVDEVLADPLRLNTKLGHYTNYLNLLDYSALALPAGHAGKLPFGITLVGKTFAERQLLDLALRMETPRHTLAVCGAHLRGQPLHHELQALGAVFLEATTSAPHYKMYAFSDGTLQKPAMLRTPAGGVACHVELYELSAQAFARFIAAIPAPLGLGKIELADGRRVSGFIGEADIPAYAHDISHLADWRKYTRA